MIKDMAKSIKARLYNIARREKIDYQLLIIRYLHERLLYRLSVSRYKDNFFLKGGLLLYVLEKDFPRPTLDIDFLGKKIKNDTNTMTNVFGEILAIWCDDGVQFDMSTIHAEEISESKVYHGVRVTVIAKMDTIRQTMRIDIGFGDAISTAQSLIYPVLINKLPAPEILAYSLESVVAEKFQTMIELSEVNSRYKDFYDVYMILFTQKTNDAALSEAIRATFSNRATSYRDTHPFFSESFMKDENRNMQWKRFLKRIKHDNELSFEDVMSLIIIKLQPIYKTLNTRQL